MVTSLTAPGGEEIPVSVLPARWPNLRSVDHRFSGAALNAPSQPDTGDSACLHGKIWGGSSGPRRGRVWRPNRGTGV